MITRGIFIVAIGAVATVCQAAENRVDYLEEIKPILRERCFACHGVWKQKAGLRLDTVEGMLRGGDSGAVITRGDASKNILLERVSAADVTERMPPEHEGDPLSVAQIALLRAWIEQGATAPADEQPELDPRDHWAFRPIIRPAVPVEGHQGLGKNPIDAFLGKERQKHGLTPQAEAPRIILLRRLYLDLIGIPPSAEDITAFKNDQSPEWYERTVSRLLGDPRHGERWARHWMDIWRYSDWWGFSGVLRNSQKYMWHWRDWIVESLNADTPYAEMVRLMLAADELHPNDLDQLRATGYLARNYFLFNRNQWMEQTVEHVSKGFLGLTLNCAKCHDHKYDPIRQVDFYGMRAFFEAYHVRIDVVPGESDLTRDGIPRVYDGLIDTPTYRFVRGQENNPDRSTAIVPGVPEILTFEELEIKPVSLPLDAWQPGHRPWVIDAHLAATKKSVDEAEEAIARIREKLADAEHSEAELLARIAQEETTNLPPEVPASLDTVRAAVAGAKADLRVAEMAVAGAKADRVCIDRCADAARATGAVADNKSDDNNTALGESAREKIAAAVRAERHALLAKAQHSVAAAELEVAREKDNKENADERLQAARESLKEALAAVEAEVKPTDRYTRLWGAKWTATRFLDSQTDDPTVGFPPQSTGRRTALANWITDRRNPLTARVAANHIWMRHMGTPLVPTVFDFGRNGTRPTHPELLDWLAIELIDSGWSMKHLHQLIVNSAAYRMGSSLAGGDASARTDPDNRYWWRRVAIRLESQVVRDSILVHTGMLNPTIGGPSVPPEEQETSKRRSLYFFHSNNDRNLFLTTFDEAMVTACYRRDHSIVPQQALALANSSFVLDSSKQILQQLSEGTVDEQTFIRKAFATLLGITASDMEIAASKRSLHSWQELPNGSTSEARKYFVWALINHNDFVTLR
jgi:hypothetical protein